MSKPNFSPFWLVAGDGPSSFRHTSRASAEAEAERLARTNPGVDFVIMAPVVVFRCGELTRTDLVTPDRAYRALEMIKDVTSAQSCAGTIAREAMDEIIPF